jgi:hypothetical protein
MRDFHVSRRAQAVVGCHCSCRFRYFPVDPDLVVVARSTDSPNSWWILVECQVCEVRRAFGETYRSYMTLRWRGAKYPIRPVQFRLQHIVWVGTMSDDLPLSAFLPSSHDRIQHQPDDRCTIDQPAVDHPRSAPENRQEQSALINKRELANRSSIEYRILKTLWTKQVNRFPRYEGVWSFRLNSRAPDFLEAHRAAGKLIRERLVAPTTEGQYYLTLRGFEFCKKNYRDFPEVEEWLPDEKLNEGQLNKALGLPVVSLRVPPTHPV